MKTPRKRFNWKALRSSVGFKNLWLFLIFVLISALFWIILALNDSVQDSFDVRLKINGVPDSVTFINVPPTGFHVTVRDKGSSLMRTAWFRHPTVNYDFKEVASNGIVRLTRADMVSGLRGCFGSGAQFVSVGIDSLRLKYVCGKGKRVPVVVDAVVSAEAGNVIVNAPVALISRVSVYADRSVLDTITRVYTAHLVKRNLSESQDFKVSLMPVQGARVIPDEVTVRVDVEPLVSKDTFVEIEAVGVPEGVNLLLFPSKVKVSCFVPMSRFSDDKVNLRVYVDYNDIDKLPDAHLPLHVADSPQGVVNPRLDIESVEYTIVKY